MVQTVEPGLYFQADDLTVPEEYRGIGVRIEDDILVTAEGNENLSAGLPRRVPRANLVPGSVTSGGGQEPEAGTPARSAESVRNRMASFQRGVREGRAAAPQIEEP